jgi:hypothetical protein
MNNDPFDTLARQLVRAVGARSRRRSRLSPRRGGLALVFAVLVGGGAAAAAGVFGGTGESRVLSAIAAGERQASTTPACQSRRHRPAPRIVRERVDARVARQFAIFRRPTRAADRAVLARISAERVYGPGGSILRNGVRVAHPAAGVRVALVVSQAPFLVGAHDPVGCALAQRESALAHVGHGGPSIRARVARIMNGRVAAARRVTVPSTEALAVFLLAPNGHARGGSATIITNGRVPAMSGFGPTGSANRRRVLLWGIVPDAVRNVRIVDRGGPRGRRVHPIVDQTHDNLYYVLAPRRMGPRIAIQWRGADGHILRTTRVSF